MSRPRPALGGARRDDRHIEPCEDQDEQGQPQGDLCEQTLSAARAGCGLSHAREPRARTLAGRGLRAPLAE